MIRILMSLMSLSFWTTIIAAIASIIDDGAGPIGDMISRHLDVDLSPLVAKKNELVKTLNSAMGINVKK